MIYPEYDMPHYKTENQPLFYKGGTTGHYPILIHVSSGPDHKAKYFSSFNAAVYLQRMGFPVTMFFNGDGVNGLVKGRLEKMTGSPDAVKTITQQLGMPIPHFLNGDHPITNLDWALTFVRHGGVVTYCGTTNTWVGNAREWSDRSNMEAFAIPLNIPQVAEILINREMKYIAF